MTWESLRLAYRNRIGASQRSWRRLRRFKEREKIKHKNFKITPEDWRNRDKWDAYQRAASDMIERTHTKHAPWVMVEANDKYFARVKILKELVERVESHLEGRG